MRVSTLKTVVPVAMIAFSFLAGPAAAQTEITPAASAVTASTNDGNVPGNVVDNNLGTRWSANGDGQWIQLDLGTEQTVGFVKVAVYNGNSRQNHFDLQVSSGGGVWTTVWSGSSSGTTTAEQTYDFTDQSARWVRYLGHMNTVNGFNSVTEISVFSGTGSPTPTPTAGSTATPTPTATPTAPPTATATPAPTATPGGPTNGWTQTSWTYTVHKPFVLPLSDRFRYTSGTWYTWVYKTDWCMHETCGDNEGKRTELRWNNNYTSGQRMWDSDMYLVSGTHEATVQQVFGGATSATASQIRAFTDSGGSYRRYGSQVLATGVNEIWVNGKVAHDANNNVVRIWMNDSLKTTEPDRGNNTHYFKNGVYVGTISSTRSEMRFRNTKQWAR
jgi:hypothetical protein